MFRFTEIRVSQEGQVGQPAREYGGFSMWQNWDEPDQTRSEWLMLEAEAAYDLCGLWSVVKAAQQATLRIALDPIADPDLSMTHAAMDLRELLEELEWAHPAVPMLADAVNVGDTPSDRAASRETIAAQLRQAWQAAAIAPVPRGNSGAAEILMLARVVHLLMSAHQRVVGIFP
jgi:hypothetical protein